jgi:phage-related protein (TIGR01555 family)
MNTPNRNYPELGSQPKPETKQDTSVLGSMQMRLDNWYNPVTDFGTIGKSKMPNVQYSAYEVIGREEAESLYRHDWAAGKSIDLPIFDMFREGIDWLEDEDQEANVEAIQDEFERLEIMAHVQDGVTEAWKQGGALAVLSLDDPFDDEEEVKPALVRGIKRIDIVPGGRNGLAQEVEWDTDYDSPTRGDVTHYQVTFNYRNTAFTKRIHASRVIRFDSPFETSQLQKMRNAGWNDSRFHRIYDSLRSMGVAVQSGEETLEGYTYQVLKSSGYASSIKKGNYAAQQRTLDVVNGIKSGRTVIIGEGEELTKVGTPLTGFHELADRHDKHFGAATWIPLSRLFSGESGALGGNVMGEETKNYFDWVAAMQPRQIAKPIKQLLELMSNYLNFDPNKIDFNFPPLVQLDELQFSNALKSTVESYGSLINNQVITPEEVATSMFSGRDISLRSMKIDFSDPSRQEDMMGAQEAEDLINGKEEDNPKDGEKPEDKK